MHNGPYSLPQHNPSVFQRIRLLQASRKELEGTFKNNTLPSSRRIEAAREWLRRDHLSATENMVAALAQEAHPRMIQWMATTIGEHGDAACHGRLSRLLAERDWPHSARPTLVFALELLAHRWGLDQRHQLRQVHQVAQPAIWQMGAFPLKAARAESFRRASRFAKQYLPNFPISEDYALSYGRADREYVVVFSRGLEQASNSGHLTKPSAVWGMVTELLEGHARLHGWIMARQNGQGKVVVDIVAPGGKALFSGQGEWIEGALHLTLHTVAQSGESPILVTLGLRPQQLLRGGMLLRAGEEPLAKIA